VLKKILGALGAVLFTAVALTACTSDADMASENLSKAAEQFEVQRRITVVNSFTDKVVFEVEGRCSIETGGTLVVTCKHGPNDFRKHYTGLGDNGMYLAEQLDPLDVDVYRTRLIIKPETVIPDPDLETSGDLEGDG
jgi:hypothetical protein